MEAVDVRGRFVWHELMTRDVAGARKFYENLTGWKTQAWPLDPTYTVCTSSVGPAAGMFPIPADFPAEVPAHWLNSIGTRDVDGTVAAAVRAGGSIVKEAVDLPGAGRYAVLKDPQGAVFAILDPENARAEPTGVPPAGTFSWHELATSDLEAAFSFYQSLFGWDALTRMDMGPLGTYLIFGWDGQQRGGIYNKPPDMPAPPNWLPYAQHDDADAGAKVAQSGGATIVSGPMDVPGGSRIVAFIDPTGATFAIVSTAAGASVPAQSPKSVRKAKPAPKKKAAVKKKKVAPRKKAKAKPVRVKVKTRTPVKAKAKAKAKSKSKAKAGTKAKAKSKAKSKKKSGARRKK